MTQVEERMLELLDGIGERLDRIEGRLDRIEARLDRSEAHQEEMDQKFSGEIHKLHLLIENDLSRKIDAIGEGHDFVLRRLDEVAVMGNHWERVDLNQINLKMDVDRIKVQLNLA